MLSKEKFYSFIGYIENALAHDERTLDFIETLDKIMELVEEASMEDFYGTEGFEHVLGWD